MYVVQVECCTKQQTSDKDIMVSSSSSSSSSQGTSPYAGQGTFAVPLEQRAERGVGGLSWVRALLAPVLLLSASVIMETYWILSLLLLRPFPALHGVYDRNLRWLKGNFASLLTALNQLFAPTTIVLTFSDEQGNLLEPERFVRRDAEGQVAELRLPERSVWISNHQVRVGPCDASITDRRAISY